jgi:hypothetical protein
MAARRSHPWRMLLPLALVVTVAALWLIYWTVASTLIEKAYVDAERELQAQGVSLACREANWGGFPFRVERDCAAPEVTVRRSDGDIAGSASHLLIAVQAYDPRHAIALLDGPTMLRGLTIGEIRHERALASVNFSDGRSWRASIELPKPVIDGIGSADRLLAHARETGGPNVDLALSAEGLDIPIDSGSKLAIDNLEIAASLPEDLAAKDIARALARTGKEIAITSLSAKQGELTVTGSGTIGIDSDGYLTGRIPTEINRIDLLFDLVERLVPLSDDDAAAAKTLIDLLQKSKTGDTELDLIAKNRKLYWGPFKLADLQPLF